MAASQVPDMHPSPVQSPLYEEQVRIIQKIKSEPIDHFYERVNAEEWEPLYNTVQYSTKRTLIKLRSKDSGRDYVAKVFPVHPTDHHAYQKASREITLHVLAFERCNDNVLEPRRIFYNEDDCGQTWLYFVVDYWPEGTLYDLLKRQFLQKLRFRTTKIRQFVRQIANALRVMHVEMGVAHRDIKPENILVGENKQLKLCDFGFAKQVYHSTDSSTNQAPQLITPVYSKDYASPEIVRNVETQGGTPYDMKCDVWALGIITYVFHTGKFPFYSRSGTSTDILDDELRYKIKEGHADWGAAVWQEDTLARDLVQGMLQVEPDRRLSIQNVLDHRWFHSGDDLQSPSEPQCLATVLPRPETLASGDHSRLPHVTNDRLLPKGVYHDAHGDLSTAVFINGQPAYGGHRRTDSGLTTVTEATDVQRVWQDNENETLTGATSLSRKMEAYMMRQRSMNTMPDTGILNIQKNPLYQKRREMSLKRKQKALENYKSIHSLDREANH